MKNWIYYRGSEYRLHSSYGWVKRESNESFDEAINKLKTKLIKEKIIMNKLNYNISLTAFKRFSDSVNDEILDLILTDNFSEFNKVIDDDIDNQYESLREFFLEKLTSLLKLDLNARLEYNEELLVINNEYLMGLKREGVYIRNN